MKVALVVPGGVDRSGTHRVIPALLWLIRRIARAHEVHVFSMRGGERPDRFVLDGASVHELALTGAATLPTLRAIQAEHRRGRFDVLHAFWASGPGVPAALAARLLRRPLLLHVTGGDTAAIPALGYGGLLTATGRARARFALSAATVLTAPSEMVAEVVEGRVSATASRLPGHGRPVERLPLGVDRGAWPPVEPRPRAPGAPARLVHVGSLNPVKDQATLLAAARRLAEAGVDFTLEVAGEDAMGGRVQAMAAGAGLNGRVRFRGFLPQERLRPVVAGADVLVLSSLHEADPVAVLEAAMAGVPTVGTRVGHVRDWSPDAAVAVAPGDADALAAALVALLSDEPRRLRLAAAAHDRAAGRDADWSAGRILEIYDRMTETSR